jgi:hypothetical protein
VIWGTTMTYAFFVVGDGGRIVAGGVTLTGLPVAAVA